MKKSLYLAFIGILALSMGCAVSEYPLITDTEGDASGFVVNTNGKALGDNTGSQVITLWPDANEEIFFFVDQGFDGIRHTSNYINRSFSGTYFLDHQYCNPDWTGCSVLNSTDDGGALFDDYVLKYNCAGFRSVSLIRGYTGSLEECGRSLMGTASFETAREWANQLVPGRDAGTYRAVLTRNNLSVRGVTPMGTSKILPIYSAHELVFTPEKGVTYKMGPGIVPTALAMARLADDFGITQWEITAYGQTIDLNIKVLSDQLTQRMRRGL